MIWYLIKDWIYHIEKSPQLQQLSIKLIELPFAPADVYQYAPVCMNRFSLVVICSCPDALFLSLCTHACVNLCTCDDNAITLYLRTHRVAFYCTQGRVCWIWASITEATLSNKGWTLKHFLITLWHEHPVHLVSHVAAPNQRKPYDGGLLILFFLFR